MSCFPPLHSRRGMVPLIREDEREGDPATRSHARSASVPVKIVLNDETTPTKPPKDNTRSVLTELTASSSHLNLKYPAFNENTEATFAANRLIDFTRGTHPRSRHALILAPQHKRRFSKTSQRLTPEDASDADSTITDVNTDLGGRGRPIMHFRPNLWRHLERDRSTLNIDLFWPLKTTVTADSLSGQTYRYSSSQIAPPLDDKQRDIADDDSDIFPLEDLRPLCEFRHLRSLKLNTMLRSYQKYIWQACWLNPGLEDLTLEMALAPDINNSYRHLYATIGFDWKMRSEEDGSEYYLGQHGEGILSPDYGIGEYFDKHAIGMAKLDAAPRGGRLRYLPVVKLAISGFVIDAGAMKWFDPVRLRQIELKHNCVDAGFALPANMIDLVKISWPSGNDCRMVKMTKVNREEVQHITLKKGQKVDESVGIKPKISSILTHRWFSINKTRTSKGDDEDYHAKASISSSNSMSSLGQRSSLVVSRKSQDLVVL